MSWFSRFFPRKRDEQPAAPRPVDPAYQAYLDQKNAPEPSPAVPPTPILLQTDPRYPYGRRRDGTRLNSQAEADAYKLALKIRDDNQEEVSKLMHYRYWNGPIPASSLTDEECAFLFYVDSNYKWDAAKVQNQSDAWFAILNGPNADIARAVQRGDMLCKAGYNPGAYQGRLRALVDDVANGRLKPKISYPGLPAGVKDPTK